MLDNFSTGNRRTSTGSGRRGRRGRAAELRARARAVRGIEVVFHLGALGSVPRSVQDPLTTSAVNVEGTLNVLLAARDAGVRRVVFASSSSVYGSPATLPRREECPRPDLALRRREARRRALLRQLQPRLRVFETVVLRYFNVFGPRQRPDTRSTRQSSRSSSPRSLQGEPVDVTATGSSRATSPTSTMSSTRPLAPRTGGASGRTSTSRAARPASVNQVAETIGGPRQAGRARLGAGAGRGHPRLLGGHHGSAGVLGYEPLSGSRKGFGGRREPAP